MTAKQSQLPHEIVTRSPKLIAILLTLLCPWLVFALANLGANLYLRNFPQNRGYWLIQEKWSLLTKLKQPVDWLVLGDSSCNQGVIPEILETELAGKAVNLCTIGDTIVLNDAWMLSKHIQEYGAPKNIAIIHVYDVWQREINWNVTSQTPLSWGYWNELEPKVEVSPQQQKDLFLNRYVPLYSQNTSLKKVIENSDRWFKAKDYQLSGTGFMSVPEADTWNVEQDAKGHIKSTSKQPSHNLSATNQKAMDSIIQLAEEHDINVYLVNSPLYEELYQNPDFRAYYDRVQIELDQISQRSDKVKRVMTTPMTFSKEEMENADHVITEAAEAYTKQLAQEIKQVSTLSSTQ